MKKVVRFGFPLISSALLLVACDLSNGIKVANMDNGNEEKNDSVEKVEEEDELQLFEETPLPKAADELFDDFFFNFVSNNKFQTSRVAFPLKVEQEGETSQITSAEWKDDDIFASQDFYTTIYERDDELELKKDTSVNSVNVEWIHLNERTIDKYKFMRVDGQWMLTGMEKLSMDETPNGSFLDFYCRFSTDSVFQRENIAEPLLFNMPVNEEIGDMGDDEMDEGGTEELTPDDWFELAKEMPLPKDVLVNIEYGQAYFSENVKHLLVQGVSNGLFVKYTFKKYGEWQLVEIEN
ncbi:MAG: DUF4348 domain-containing protein [Bacteroidaceae bacterium]|nr:DUF4348 domain-containing protein [Bacteroidaceae bacterium]